jgi:S1-C subfamily serine protease
MLSPFTNLSRPGFAALAVWMASALAAPLLARQTPTPAPLPEEVRGIKVYKLPTKGGEPAPNFGIYKKLTYRDINWNRLLLDLSISIRPVDHPATVVRMYFQDVQVNGIPVHIETFTQQFKLSNKEPVDVPAPLACSIVFADLDSLQPVRDFVDKDTILITGQSFVEVKLSTLEKFAERARRMVIRVPLNETVPLNLFQGSPFLHMTAAAILDTLVNPSSSAAVKIAKEHVAKLQLDESLGAKVKSALYLVLTEYRVRDPKSQASEQFSQSGTGFLVSADGKLLTTKRVVAPWKFDPQVALLVEHQHLELEKDSVKIYAWPAGSQVSVAEGQLDFSAALSTEKQSLKILRMPPDAMVQQDYLDPDSGEKVSLRLHAEGLSDLALLQLAGTGFQALALQSSGSSPAAAPSLVLCSYPFGSSQPQIDPRLLGVQASLDGSTMNIDHNLDPGESGAPLLNADGRVVAMATSAEQCIPIGVAQSLIP